MKNITGVKKEIRSRIITCVVILAIGILASLGSELIYSDEKTLLKDQVIRLHVIAESDSEKDQVVKLAVRDAIIEYAGKILSDVRNRDEAIETCRENLGNFTQVAKKVLENSYDFVNVDAELLTTSFPAMSYGKILLPKDDYLALEIKIGKACGSNWWCVIFPTLCVADVRKAKVVQATTKTVYKTASPKIQGVSRAVATFELPGWADRIVKKVVKKSSR